MKMKKNLRWIFALIILIPLIGATAYLSSAISEPNDGQATSSDTNEAVADEAVVDEAQDEVSDDPVQDVGEMDEEADRVEIPFPLVEDMEKVAESDVLILYADRATGHFIVEDKRDGERLSSYPNADHWHYDTTSGVWKESHLQSPLFFEMINLDQENLQAILASSINRGAVVTDWQNLDNGFSLVFKMESLSIEIPVKVFIEDDYVSVTVLEEGFKEDANFKVINLKAYPFFGAVSPYVEDGFLLLPDGPGAIYKLKPNIWRDRTIYRQPVYGFDYAYNTNQTWRKDVRLPVIGYNTGDKAFLIVAHEGEESSYAYAAPSTANATIYNWATFEHQYRLRYYQPTRVSLNQGFFTYSTDRFEGNREVRYYLLEDEQSDYPGMGARFRDYLIEEKNVTSKVSSGEDLPLYLTILGGDIEKGTFTDRYITGTTTEEAKKIVNRLVDDGVANMKINWLGWQNDGLTNMGFKLNVEKKLGGNSGMKSFIKFAHEHGFPVTLTMTYDINSDGKAFNPRTQALQNEGGQIMEYTDYLSNREYSLVSPLYQLNRLERTVDHYASLGIDGLYLTGTGDLLITDYNQRYFASRMDAADAQEQMLDIVRKEIGSVWIDAGNAYALEHIDYISNLYSDYSYDIFIDEVVPFSQIVLHGLIPYSTGYANLWDEYETQFLRDIEYGSMPSYLVMNAETNVLKEAFTANQFFSVNFDDWEQRIVEGYARYNEALGDVQDQFIVGHKTLRNNVKETVYENGKRIIVNYNNFAVTVDGTEIPARDFAVLNGGGNE